MITILATLVALLSFQIRGRASPELRLLSLSGNTVAGHPVTGAMLVDHLLLSIRSTNMV
jgi:hypothetical protein